MKLRPSGKDPRPLDMETSTSEQETPIPFPERPGVPRGMQLLLLGGALLFAIVLRCIHLDRGAWIDEITTWAMTREGVWEMVRARAGAGHLPLYFVIVSLWQSVVPEALLWLRIPSVLFSLATIGLLPWMANGRLSFPVLCLACWFVAIHPGDIWSAQTGRMYSMLALMGVVSTGLFLRFLEHRSWGLLTAFAAVTLAGLLTQPVYLPVVAVQGFLGLIVLWEDRAWLWRWIGAGAVAGVLALPAWLLMTMAGGVTVGARDPQPFQVLPLADLSAGLVAGDFLLLNDYLTVPRLLAALALLFAAAGVLRALARCGQEETGRFRLLMFIAILIPVYMSINFLLIQYSKHSVGGMRYYFPLIPFVAIGLALGVEMLPRLIQRFFVVAGLSLFLLFQTSLWLAWEGDGLTEAIAEARATLAPGEVLFGCEAGAAYYAWWLDSGEEPGEWLVPVSRYIQDEMEVAGMVQRHLDNRPGSLLLLFHEKASPLKSVLREREDIRVEPAFEKRNARLYRLRRVATLGQERE